MRVSLRTFIHKFDDLFLPLSSTQCNTHEFIIAQSSLSSKQREKKSDENRGAVSSISRSICDALEMFR